MQNNEEQIYLKIFASKISKTDYNCLFERLAVRGQFKVNLTKNIKSV